MKMPPLPLKHFIVVGSFAIAAMTLAVIAGYRLEVRQLGLIWEPSPIVMEVRHDEIAAKTQLVSRHFRHR